jgi:Ulp1 family protease
MATEPPPAAAGEEDAVPPEEPAAAGKGRGKGGKAEGDPPVEEKKVAESLRRLQAEMNIRDLIEDAGLKFAKPDARKAFVKSLIPLTESERETMIDERKELTETSRYQQPRSQAPGRQLTESKLKFPTSYSEAKGLLSLNN